MREGAGEGGRGGEEGLCEMDGRKRNVKKCEETGIMRRVQGEILETGIKKDSFTAYTVLALLDSMPSAVKILITSADEASEVRFSVLFDCVFVCCCFLPVRLSRR